MRVYCDPLTDTSVNGERSTRDRSNPRCDKRSKKRPELVCEVPFIATDDVVTDHRWARARSIAEPHGRINHRRTRVFDGKC